MKTQGMITEEKSEHKKKELLAVYSQFNVGDKLMICGVFQWFIIWGFQLGYFPRFPQVTQSS